MLRRRTVFLTSVASVMLTKIPLVPAAKIEAKVPWPSIVIDLLMVTVPKPPGSRASISPSLAVFEIAPANVLQGAVRLHGLVSLPTPDTHVLVACACAKEERVMMNTTHVRTLRVV